MDYLIGMDGGGTKTEAVLFDGTGHILARDISRGCNALDLGEQGIEIAKERLGQAVLRLHEKLPAGGKLTTVYGGIAGSVDYFPGVLDRELTPKLPCANIRWEGDGGNLIAAMRGHGDGCSLISGTGASLYIRRKEKLSRYGGWGYLIDMNGSGYTMGRDAFLASFRALDGRGPKTVLYELIQKQMGMDPSENIPYIYRGGKPYIATFARTVFEGRRMGDQESIRIFNYAVHSLAELVWLAEKELGPEFDVVTGGGVFAAWPEFGEELKKQIPAGVKLVPLNVPPILGAAVEALWDAGLPDTEEFRTQFMKDYTSQATMRNGNCGGEDSSYEQIYR